jgi:hypothetical protein
MRVPLLVAVVIGIAAMILVLVVLNRITRIR